VSTVARYPGVSVTDPFGKVHTCFHSYDLTEIGKKIGEGLSPLEIALLKEDLFSPSYLNPVHSGDVSQQWVGDRRLILINSIMSNPELPSDLLTGMLLIVNNYLFLPDYDTLAQALWERILDQKEIPPSSLENQIMWILRYAGYPDGSFSLLEKAKMIYKVLDHPNLDKSVISNLCVSNDPNLRNIASAHPSCPEEGRVTAALMDARLGVTTHSDAAI
jgi:hypothetical protein